MNIILRKHLEENYKTYLIFIIVFILGIFIGIITLNNSNDEQKTAISSYINEFIEVSKSSKVDYTQMLKSSISKNFKFIIITIILDLSMFRLIASNLMIGYKGFTLRVLNFKYNCCNWCKKRNNV